MLIKKKNIAWSSERVVLRRFGGGKNCDPWDFAQPSQGGEAGRQASRRAGERAGQVRGELTRRRKKKDPPQKPRTEQRKQQEQQEQQELATTSDRKEALAASNLISRSIRRREDEYMGSCPPVPCSKERSARIDSKSIIPRSTRHACSQINPWQSRQAPRAAAEQQPSSSSLQQDQVMKRAAMAMCHMGHDAIQCTRMN